METFSKLESTDNTFYTEQLIQLGLNDKISAKKYGWLIEPRWYNPMAAEIKKNPEINIEIVTNTPPIENTNIALLQQFIKQNSF